MTISVVTTAGKSVIAVAAVGYRRQLLRLVSL
jgi:hypothetical protein